MSLIPIRTVAPATYPVTSAEVKAQLQIDSGDTTWDTLIDAYIAAATAYLDGYSGILGRCIISQTWEARFECFESEFELPFPDVSAVVVKYYDIANALQTYSSSYYQLVQEACGSVVSVYPTSVYPALSVTREDRVVITMTVGYSSVPAAIKQAILMIIGHWFTNRETVAIGQTVADIPFGASALLAPYRRVGV